MNEICKRWCNGWWVTVVVMAVVAEGPVKQIPVREQNHQARVTPLHPRYTVTITPLHLRYTVTVTPLPSHRHTVTCERSTIRQAFAFCGVALSCGQRMYCESAYGFSASAAVTSFGDRSTGARLVPSRLAAVFKSSGACASSAIVGKTSMSSARTGVRVPALWGSHGARMMRGTRVPCSKLENFCHSPDNVM